LTYNPTLFTPTGASTGDSTGTGSTFTMGTISSVDAAHSKVNFTWHNGTGLTGTVVLGDILGDVPISAANLYKGKELLDLSDATAVSSLAAFTSNLHPVQIPAIPTGLTIVAGGPDPTLSLAGGQASSGIVSVLLDHPRPEDSTGMTEAILALTYDPKVLSVSASDISLGSIPGQGTGWRLVSVIDPVTGQIAIDLFSTTAITATQGGSLVNIAFHIQTGEPGGVSPRSMVQLVNSVAPNGQWFSTEVADGEGKFV